MGLFTSFTDAIGLTNYGDSQAAVQRAAGYFNSIGLPQLQELGLESVGDMSPEQIRVFLQEASAYDNIYVDPRLKAQQNETLAGLQELSKTGMNATDRAQLAQIRSEEETAARGAREAILMNAQERGLGGSGLELMSQMQNQQDAATRASARDTQVAALAQQRRDQALMQSGQMAGQMREQEFGEQERVAQARDLMNRFNLANRQQVEAQNVGARNAAQQYNLANRQQLSNANRQWAAGLPQQQFNNQLGLAQGQAGAQYQLANMYNSQSAANMNMLGQGAMAAAMFASDEETKKDIKLSPEDIDNFLNELSGFKYSYKDAQKHGEGERLGVMAQDMEKSKLGKDQVVEKDGVKHIDSNKATSALLASVARLNERLNNVEGKK